MKPTRRNHIIVTMPTQSKSALLLRLFCGMQDGSKRDVTVRCSFLEIYNEVRHLCLVLLLCHQKPTVHVHVYYLEKGTNRKTSRLWHAPSAGHLR